MWIKTDGVYSQMVPLWRHWVEAELVSLDKSYKNRTTNAVREVRFQLNIGGKLTAVLASIEPETIVLHLLDAPLAYEETLRILDGYEPDP